MTAQKRINGGSIVLFLSLSLAACVERQPGDGEETAENQAPVLAANTGVLTQHNDIGRSGANLNESILTQANVKTNFGWLTSLPVSGQIYTQPLYLAGAINGLNAVFITTEENRVYAFHADPPWEPLWQTNLETAWSPAGFTCSNSIPPFGINSTPVIDLGASPPATATMYVVTRSLQASKPTFLLHAINLVTGADRAPPIDMSKDSGGVNTISVSGTGMASSGGKLTFDPSIHQNRVALTLSGGVLSVGFGSYCDHDMFHGWILRFDVTKSPIAPLTPFVTTPNTSLGAVWMGGGGFSADANGALYFTSGNGPKLGGDTTGATEFGDAFVKLTGSTTVGPAVSSWFMPGDVVNLDKADTDVGSSSPLLIPGTPYIIGGGKNGIFYVLNKDTMGGFKGVTPETAPQVVQRFSAASPNWIVGSPVWYESSAGSRMYVWPGKTPLQEYTFDRMQGTNGLFNTTPELGGDNPQLDPQGGQLSISANGSGASSLGTGILWATHASESPGDGKAHPGVVYAYSADHVATKLWDSTMHANDNLASYAKYTPPTIANGRVFVATFSNVVEVYGLLGGSPDAGVRDAGARDVPQDTGPPLLTCANVDGGTPQPTTWSYVYNTYFAGPSDGGATTPGHCAECHGAASLANFWSKYNKDDCYQGLITVGQVTTDGGTSSAIADPTRSALSWFGTRNPGPGIFLFMPQDQQQRNSRAVAAVCGWVKAGAINDQANGQACTAANQCTSGFCADGFCCNTACGTACNACSAAKTGGANGTCAAMTTGAADARCGSAPPCGKTGLCAAAGVCAVAPPTTSCRAASCSAGTATAAATCGGSLTCPAPVTSSCGAFICGATACKTTCAADTDCVTGDFCSGTACTPKKANGSACTATNQCTSGSCVDGFCCNTACTGSCTACSAAKTGGTNGTCANMTAGGADSRCGSAPPCGATGLCAAAGVCAVAAPTTSCRAASCSGSTATAAATCGGSTTCPAPVTSSCGEFLCGATACATSCTTSANCVAGAQCTGGVCVGCTGGVCKSNGTACTAAADCASGFCADGFCCNTACGTACNACSAAKTGGTNGTCAVMTTGGADSRCGSAPPCGNTGLCAAAGVCAVAAPTTSCRAASCSAGTATAAATCGGSLTCPAPVTSSCGAFVCGATACKTTCAADTDCATGDFCSGTACVAKKANGAACTATDQCTSGSCVDGFCCNTACTGSCTACSAAKTGGTNGTCASMTTGSADSRCGSAPPCGNTGLCAAAGVCAIAAPTTSCRAASCSGSTATAAATCGGSTTCPAPVTSSCGEFLCGATACATSCTTGANCVTGAQCIGGLCVGCTGGVCKSNGTACTAGADCASGFCADGFCCNTACGTACNACSAAKTGGTNGTCAVMTTGGADSRCGSAPPCGNTGLCAAAGVCAVAAPTTSCRAASCSAGTATAAATCGGSLTCPAPVTSSCGAFVCGATACKTTCAADTDCATGDFCSGTTCVAKKATGSTCTAADQCTSAACSTDGVCCSATCSLSCQACTLAKTGLATGTCGPSLTPAGTNVCNNACVNTLTDPANCGGCGKVCATGATCSNGACSAAACTAAIALIDDFEDGNNQISLLDGRNGPIYTYADTVGSTISPAAGSIFAPGTPGNGTSTRAAHVTGKLAATGTVWAGLGLDFLSPKALYNGSKYTGISFFAKKGSTTASSAVRVKIPDRNTDPTGGVCTSCSNDFGSDLTLSTTWTKFTIPFTSMTQQAGWGVPRPAAIDKTGIVAVQIQVTALGASYDIWVDDLTFTCN